MKILFNFLFLEIMRNIAIINEILFLVFGSLENVI
jgi:hypothetical protein